MPTQTYCLQDVSYLRLKNLQLGYTLPASLTSQAGISNFRVFLSGENLLTFTGLTSIFDPETVALAGWNDGRSEESRVGRVSIRCNGMLGMSLKRSTTFHS